MGEYKGILRIGYSGYGIIECKKIKKSSSKN